MTPGEYTVIQVIEGEEEGGEGGSVGGVRVPEGGGGGVRTVCSRVLGTCEAKL